MPQLLKCRSKRSARGFSRKPAYKIKSKKNSFHRLHGMISSQAALVSNSPQTGCLATIRRNMRNVTPTHTHTKKNKISEMHKCVKTTSLTVSPLITKTILNVGPHLQLQGGNV